MCKGTISYVAVPLITGNKFQQTKFWDAKKIDVGFSIKITAMFSLKKKQ